MRLIDANKLMEHLTRCIDAEKGLFRAVCVAIKCFVEQMPTVDSVSRGVHDQVRWERDIAIEQLESYSISLGEKAYAVKLPYEPKPCLKDDNPHNTDVYCPVCGTNLSGYFGGASLPIVTCFECGEIINPYMAMTKDELAEWRKGRQ